MKKLLMLLVGIIFLGSCFEGSVVDAPYIVQEVKKIGQTDVNADKKYRVIATSGENKVAYYTNTLYTVGDTLRMK